MHKITGFIYYLQNPETGEIFYIGQTQCSLKNRLRTHYQHLREYERGIRKWNRRYEYLKNLRPIKAQIGLLEIVTDEKELETREIFYIKQFRKINPKITNMTDGGKGKYTSKYYTEKELEEYSRKISKANKGKPKPEGFAKNLSEKRKGKQNPAAKELNNWIVCMSKEIPVRMFKYGFEINNYIKNKHAYGNVCKFINSTNRPYKMKWVTFSSCNKEIQDIVQASYEK